VKFACGGCYSLTDVPVTVTVRAGNKITVTNSSGATVSPNPNYDALAPFTSADALYGEIEQWIQRQADNPTIYSIQATYDEQTGFPISITEDSGGTEGPTGVEVSDFQVLQ
jgi:hypothetical protein